MDNRNRDRAALIRKIYLISFLAPLAVLLLILGCSRVWPIGENCFLRTDMYHQYAPFHAEFASKLHEGGSLLYSWHVGLGVNFVALYAYYLASPLNWLLIFVPQNLVIEFMMAEVVLKLSLASLCMSHYLLRHAEKPDIGIAFFGIFYGLSGFMCAYYWNLMWLDAVMLFPLVVRGMEEMIFNKKCFLYTAALGTAILSNYYICIMMCIFLVIYFIALNILRLPESLEDFAMRGVRFGLCSLLAGGLAAALLIPEIYALQGAAAASSVFPKSWSEYFSILQMLARHLPCVETEQGLEHWPNIYCGLFVFLLMPLYIGSRKISIREKAVYLSLLLLFLMSFAVNVLNYIWHGMHYPNSLPARQSYIYVFLVLYMCFRAWDRRAYAGVRQLGGALLAGLLFILLAQALVKEKYFHFAIFYGSLAALSIYAGLMYLEQTGRLRSRYFLQLMLVLIIAEAAGNAARTSITVTSRKAYTSDNADVRTLVSELEPSTDFYRVKKVTRKTRNDGAWMQYPSVSLFSSLASAKCTSFFKSVGCEASTNAYSINASTPFVNMLMSVKYSLYSNPPETADGMKFLRSSGDTYLYENLYSLPAGIVMPRVMAEEWLQVMDNPALVQNGLCDHLGLRPVLVSNEDSGDENGKEYTATLGEDGEYYAYVTNGKVKAATVNWPGRKKSFDKLDRRYLIELGYCSQGDRIKITSDTDGQNMRAEIYRFDHDALQALYEELTKYPLTLSVREDALLEGRLTADSAALGYHKGKSRVFMSIPYDEGWQVLVDGVPAETEPVFETFLSFEVTDGTHDISMKYSPKGLKPGLIISGASLLLIVLMFVIERIRQKKAAPDALPGTADAALSEDAGEDTPDDSDEVLEEVLSEDADAPDAVFASGEGAGSGAAAPDGAETPKQA